MAHAIQIKACPIVITWIIIFLLGLQLAMANCLLIMDLAGYPIQRYFTGVGVNTLRHLDSCTGR